jgi:heme/copper-type cytochrome/quinol oxidase subunit 4
MEHLPIYISIVFVLTTFLTAALLYKATSYSKPVIVATILWLALQAVVSLTGFYTVTTGSPPRFGLLLILPVIFIIILFLTRKGKSAIDGFNAKILTLVHIVRIPVELTLYWLFLHKAVPGIITFEGRNFDILCGLTAPFIYYFGYIKNVLGKSVLIAWNIGCLLLLANVVITAVLSAPFPFQKFGFDQPDIALFYFPFTWLPCFIVPVVLFAHLATLRRLIK